MFMVNDLKKRMKLINLWFSIKENGIKVQNSIIENKIIFLLFLILLLPFCLQLNIFGLSTWLKEIVRIGTPQDWLGFWGAYLGSILTILFAYLNTRYETGKQLNIQKKEILSKSLEIVKIALAKISFNSIFKIDIASQLVFDSDINLEFVFSLEKK